MNGVLQAAVVQCEPKKLHRFIFAFYFLLRRTLVLSHNYVTIIVSNITMNIILLQLLLLLTRLLYKQQTTITTTTTTTWTVTRHASYACCETWYLPNSHVHNERTVPIIKAGCIAHTWNGHISTSGLNSDVTIVLFDPNFLKDAKISAIRVQIYDAWVFRTSWPKMDFSVRAK